jgi:hypothetical protein
VRVRTSECACQETVILSSLINATRDHKNFDHLFSSKTHKTSECECVSGIVSGISCRSKCVGGISCRSECVVL